MTLASKAILVFALVLSFCALAIGILCIVAPRRAIFALSTCSTVVTPESALDRATVLQFRIAGLVFVAGGILFVLVILGNLVG